MFKKEEMTRNRNSEKMPKERLIGLGNIATRDKLWQGSSDSRDSNFVFNKETGELSRVDVSDALNRIENEFTSKKTQMLKEQLDAGLATFKEVNGFPAQTVADLVPLKSNLVDVWVARMNRESCGLKDTDGIKLNKLTLKSHSTGGDPRDIMGLNEVVDSWGGRGNARNIIPRTTELIAHYVNDSTSERGFRRFLRDAIEQNEELTELWKNLDPQLRSNIQQYEKSKSGDLPVPDSAHADLFQYLQ